MGATAQARQRDGIGEVAVGAEPHAGDAKAGKHLEHGSTTMAPTHRWIVVVVGRIARGVHQRPDHGGLHGDIKVLAKTGAQPFVQRDGGVGGGLRARVESGLGIANGDGRTIGISLHGNEPARRLNGELAGGAASLGAGLPKGGDGRVDERGLELGKGGVVEAERGECPWIE